MEWSSLPVFVQYVTLAIKTETSILTYKCTCSELNRQLIANNWSTQKWTQINLIKQGKQNHTFALKYSQK